MRTRTTKLTMTTLIALGLLGCATNVDPGAGSPSPATGKADGEETIATLSFGADWSVTQSAPLVKGQLYVIDYDAERLPACRAQSETGEDTWHIAAYYSLDGLEPYDNEIELTQQFGGGRLYAPTEQVVDTYQLVPYGIFGGGHDFALWFRGWDDTGCEQWDSDWGQNYHFTIEDEPAPDAGEDASDAGVTTTDASTEADADGNDAGLDGSL